MGIKVIIMYFLIQMHYKQRSLFVMGDIVSKLTATPSRRQSGSGWRFASDCSEMEAD